MNIRYLCLLLCGMLLGCVKLFAQSAQVSVNNLTGTANTTIPVYSLTRGQVTLPIRLIYNATGIKPKDVEGSGGIGWNVQAGGQVNRKVRGLPDDVSGGWMNNGMNVAIANFTIHNASNIDCTGQALDTAYINDNLVGGDTEPDMFYVSAPGLSFQMIYDSTHGKFQTIPYTDVKIDTTRYGFQLLSFTVTDDRGIKYVFGQGIYNDEKTLPHLGIASGTYFQNQYQQYQSLVHYYGSWMLTSMTDANGNGVLLHYSPSDTIQRTSTEMLTLYKSFPTSPGYLAFDQFAVQRTVVPYLLDTIRTTDDDMQNNMLSFKWASNSYGTNQWFLTEIKGKGRDYQLGYKVVEYGSGGSAYKRYFLGDFADVSGINTPVNYHFDYYNVVPTGFAGNYTTILSDSLAYQHQDYWGYYTSHTDTNPNPALYVDPNNPPSWQRYEIASNAVGPGYTYFLTGNEREADPTYIMAGSLKSITYAQGGKTKFMYESNDYMETPSSSTTPNLGGGLRIKSVQDSDNVTGVIHTRNYSYLDPATGLSSGKPVSLPVFGFATPYMGSDTGAVYWNQSTMRSNLDLSEEDHTIMYEYAKVTEGGAGSTLYQYSLPQTNWNHVATKDYTAHTVCADYGAPINDHDTYPFAPNPNLDWKQGLLLKQTTYNEDSTPKKTSETIYNYTYSIPDSVVAFRFEKNETNSTHLVMFAYAKYPIYYNTTALTTSVINKIYDSQGLAQAQIDTTTYTYDATYHRVSSQAVTNSDHSVSTTNYVYTKDFTGLSSGNANPNINAIYQLQQLNINTPVETYTTITRSGTTTVTGASLTYFGSFPTGIRTMYLPSQHYQFVQPNGGSFTPMGISGTTLTKDPQYILEGNSVEYDFTGVIQTADDAHKHVNAAVLDHISYHPAIAVSNAAAYEVAFEDFDSDLIPAWTYKLPGFTGTKPTGSHVGNSRGMNTDSTFSYTIQKSKLASNYIFSVWIRSSAGGHFDFSMAPVSPSTGTTTTYTGTFASTGSAWKYFQWKLPMPVVSGGATVKVSATLSSTAVIGIDDIILYPESADVATYGYDTLTYYKIAETNTNGVSAYYTNDVWGRLLFQYDQDKNMVVKKTYLTPQQSVDTAFHMSYSPNTGINTSTVVTFSGSFGGQPGNTYSWSFDGGAFTAPSMVNYTTHTFTTVGTHTAKLRGVSPYFGTKTTPDANITVSAPPPPVVTITYDNFTSAHGDVANVIFKQGGVAIYSFAGTSLNGATIAQGIYDIEVVMLAGSIPYDPVSGEGYSSVSVGGACQDYSSGAHGAYHFNSVDVSSVTSLYILVSTLSCP